MFEVRVDITAEIGFVRTKKKKKRKKNISNFINNTGI
jgi:hypothetical protein